MNYTVEFVAYTCDDYNREALTESVNKMVFDDIHTLSAIKRLHLMESAREMPVRYFKMIVEYWTACDCCNMDIVLLNDGDYIAAVFDMGLGDIRVGIYPTNL